MSSFSARSVSATTHSPKIKPGIYTATVTDVFFDPEYVDDTMIVVEYNLIADNGAQFRYKERFSTIQVIFGLRRLKNTCLPMALRMTSMASQDV